MVGQAMPPLTREGRRPIFTHTPVKKPLVIRLFKEHSSYEANLPAQQDQENEKVRFSGAYGHEGRAARAEAPAREGTHKAFRLR